jgi:hypothetical protein
MRSRLVLFLSAVGLLGLVILVPYRSTLVRLGLIALWGIATISLVCLVWRWKVWRIIVLLGLASFCAFVLSPGRNRTDSSRLRQRFVHRLQAYDEVWYIYGGENSRGIDCSGLVRAAMVRALLDDGIASANPDSVRAAFKLWWYDSNAIQLGKGLNGLTLPIGDGGPTPMRAASNVRPGDLAVTTSGSHVLAYLGEHRWIEADPDVGRVHIVDLNTSPIAGQEVLLVAWCWLR